MTPLPLGTLLVAHRLTERELASARPDAPVVPFHEPARPRGHLFRTRSATAAVLHRAAHRIAPA